jgi:hypothetical protein
MSSNVAMEKKRIPFLATLVLLLVAISCSGAKQLTPMELTLTPLSEAVRATGTARAGNPGEAASLLLSAAATATSLSEQVYATQTAVAALSSADQLATATALAPVYAELAFYKDPQTGQPLGPTDGSVVWTKGPRTINLSGFLQQKADTESPPLTGRDFVLATSLTWNTKNSISGCGFFLRADGDQNTPNMYSLLLTRIADGHILWLALNDGDVANIQQFFPAIEDKTFNDENGATNRLAVVARGTLFDIYTNEVLVGTLDTTQPPPKQLPPLPVPPPPPPNAPAAQVDAVRDLQNQTREIQAEIDQKLAQAKALFASKPTDFSDGLLGFLGLSREGQTTCTFDNSWLFQLSP